MKQLMGFTNGLDRIPDRWFVRFKLIYPMTHTAYSIVFTAVKHETQPYQA